MPKPAPTRLTSPDADIFDIARRKAVKGHRTWLVFQHRDGSYEARIYGADAIKAAMLAAGTRGRFWWFSADDGVGSICRSWRHGIRLWRAARYQERNGHAFAA